MGVILPLYFPVQEEFGSNSLQNAAGSLMLSISMAFVAGSFLNFWQTCRLEAKDEGQRQF